MLEIHKHGSCFISKTDAKSAFRNLGIRLKDWAWLTMAAKSPIDDKWYFFVDKCVLFGASSSCSHFQKVSDSLAYLTGIVNKRSPVNYLDDYLLTAYLRNLCNQKMLAFIKICELVNFPISEEKTFWAATSLIFLGLLIDTVHRFVSIPVDKISRAIVLVEEMLSKKKMTVKQLQKLCGFLNFLCKCIIPGRAFTRRLYAKFNIKMKPHHHIDINQEFKDDLRTWLTFLNEPTICCRPFLDYSRIFTAEDLELYTDASGRIGFGGIRMGTDFFMGIWPTEFLQTCNPSIEYLELYAVTVAVMLWIKLYSNKRICIFVDNISIKSMINNTTSSCKNCMVLIRLIVLECLTWNMRLFSKYVRTKDNYFADALSRNQINRFWTLAVEKGKNFKLEEVIPEKLWPPQKLWKY